MYAMTPGCQSFGRQAPTKHTLRQACIVSSLVDAISKCITEAALNASWFSRPDAKYCPLQNCPGQSILGQTGLLGWFRTLAFSGSLNLASISLSKVQLRHEWFGIGAFVTESIVSVKSLRTVGSEKKQPGTLDSWPTPVYGNKSVLYNFTGYVHQQPGNSQFSQILQSLNLFMPNAYMRHHWQHCYLRRPSYFKNASCHPVAAAHSYLLSTDPMYSLHK